MTDIIMKSGKNLPDPEAAYAEYAGRGDENVLALDKAGLLTPNIVKPPKLSKAATQAYRFRVSEGVIGASQAEITKALDTLADESPETLRKMSRQSRVIATAAIVWEEVNHVCDLCPAGQPGLKHFTDRHRKVIEVARLMREWVRQHQNTIVSAHENHPVVLAFVRATAHYLGCVYAIMRSQDKGKRNLMFMDFRRKLGDIK